MIQWTTSRLTNSLVSAAAIVIIFAGMKAAAPILVPMLLAGFIAVITTPFFISMRRLGVPTAVALIVLVVILAAASILGAAALTESLTNFTRSLPDYLQGLQTLVKQGLDWMASKGMEQPASVLNEAISMKNIMHLAGNTVSSVTSVLGNAFLIVLIVIFILLEAALLPAKVRAMPGMTESTWRRLEQTVDNVRRYMGLKTLICLLTGFLVWVVLAACNVDYAVLLGLLAFLLNYIPTVGSLMAAIPGVLLTLAQYGIGRALIALIGYVVINVAVGNFLEPRVMGIRLGLSPMIVVVSLVFWGWVLGPVGMLLSVPLTMAAKIALESTEETQGIALLLGSSVPKGKEKEEG
jgi:AI-2 transport protein TqsA